MRFIARSEGLCDMEILDESDEGLELKFEGHSRPQSDPCPDDIYFEDQPFGIAFHPSTNLIASGLVSGAVNLYVFLVFFFFLLSSHMISIT